MKKEKKKLIIQYDSILKSRIAEKKGCKNKEA
jgi:hypothetical protein